MPRTALPGLLALVAAALAAPAAPAQETAAPPKAYIYLAYDADFLHLAARVEDPFVIGAHTEPMSEAWNDDAVGFYLDLPRLRTDFPHPRCCRLVVSAAGGFMASVGSREGTWQPARDWLAGLRLDASVQGTLNKAGDLDRGFTVEVAIPWRFLGGMPPNRARIGFNAVCFVRGENEAWVSWSPAVHTEADLDRPSAWGDLLVRVTGGPSEPTATEVIVPFHFQPIHVDGTLGAGEWIGASVIELTKPEPQPIATTPQPAARPGLACALYRFDYQADPRLGPLVGPAAPGVAGALVHQPMDAAGPWLCGQRVDWQRGQLRQVAEAGLDVILPVASPIPSGGLSHSSSLLALSRALQDTRGRGLPYPLVGLYLDLAPLAGAGPLPSDAAHDVAGAVVQFFRTIPEEFWVQLNPQGGPADGRLRLAVLGPPPAGELPADLLAEASSAFAAEFPGDRLLWLADAGWRDRHLPEVAAYCGLAQPGDLDFEADETYPTAVISPGFDDGRSPDITDRLDGSRYRSAWTKTLGLSPAIVILRSWNDFTNATEVAPSRQYGVRYLDLTRRFLTQWAQAQPGSLRLLGETLPRVLAPGGHYTLDLLLRNTSFEDIATSDRTFAGYRIEDERGKVVARSEAAFGFRLRAGETRTVVVPLSLRDDKRAPLPEGRYRVVFQVITRRVPLLASRWLEKTVAEIPVSIAVGRVPARRMTLIEASLPTRLESGAEYPLRLRLRNDGSAQWPAQSVSLGARWYRRTDGASGPLEAVGVGLRLPLPRAVAPGEVVNLRGALRAEAGGQPLPPGRYEVRFDLVEGDDDWFSGVRPPQNGLGVEVVARDAGALFVKSDLPSTLEAGSTTPVQVVVTNAGRAAWRPASTLVAAHWAYWDGSPAPLESQSAPLDHAVGPGDSAQVTVPVTAPRAAGAYWVWWDVGGSTASLGDEAGTGSLMPTPVVVSGGPYRALDLASQANVIPASPDTYRAGGNFDGHGYSLPSEFLPPDVGPIQVAAYPSGYYSAPAAASPPQREVPFTYPPQAQGRPGAVACRGQKIEIPGGAVARLHLLGAAAESNVTAEFTITYDDGSTAALPLTLSDWRGDPEHGERIAFSVACFRSQQATRRGPAHLYHYVLDLDPGKAAAALTLPDDPRVVILAITAEMSEPSPTSPSDSEEPKP